MVGFDLAGVQRNASPAELGESFVVKYDSRIYAESACLRAGCPSCVPGSQKNVFDPPARGDWGRIFGGLGLRFGWYGPGVDILSTRHASSSRRSMGWRW